MDDGAGVYSDSDPELCAAAFRFGRALALALVFFLDLASLRESSWSSVPFARCSSSASSNSLMSCSFLLTLFARACGVQ